MTQKVFTEIRAEIFPNLGKGFNIQVNEAHKT